MKTPILLNPPITVSSATKLAIYRPHSVYTSTPMSLFTFLFLTPQTHEIQTDSHSVISASGHQTKSISPSKEHRKHIRREKLTVNLDLMQRFELANS